MRHVLIILALATLGTTAAAAPASGPADPTSAVKRCKPGFRHAVIGGAHKCLRAGQSCRRSLDRRYHRYGFHCHGRRLTRVTPRPPSPPSPPAPREPNAGPLAAGDYTTTRFRPTIRFTLEAGWTGVAHQINVVYMTRGNGWLYFNSDAAATPLAQIVALMRSFPGMTATSPVPVTVAGVSGQRFELANTGGSRVVALQHSPIDHVVFEAGDAAHVYVLDVRGSTLVIVVRAPASELAAFAVVAERVLATVVFP